MSTPNVSEAVRGWVIFVQSWLVAADFAELEAPDGTETDEVFFVVAESVLGEEYRHDVTFKSEAEAERLAERVRASHKFSPLVFSRRRHWRHFRTAYGSEAYARNAPYLEAQTELADRTAQCGEEDSAYASLPDTMKAALGPTRR